jgi:methylenetetrahydrofolate reductase (NADH)
MDPMVAGHGLLKRGIEPIVQVTSRDKNRLAIQSGMLGADVLGISNLVAMGGDPPHIGDHPQAKGVNDLFSSQIIEAAEALNNGRDHAGNPIKGRTAFFIGSVFNPGAGDVDTEVENTRRKIDAGAQFFQTQAIYQVDRLKAFLDKLNRPNLHVLAGIIPIKSVKMANYMNARVPGIDIPDTLIGRISKAEQSASVVAESLTIALETINEINGLCNGIHIMAIGWEKHMNALIKGI